MNQYVFPTPSELYRLKTCPFPTPQNIEPCSCKVDEKFQVLLTCKMNQDMDEKFLQRLTNAFGCKKEVHLFHVNLNGHNWMIDFSPELFGEFKMSHFHLSDCTSIVGDIQAGAFNGSLDSLKTFQIEGSFRGENRTGVVKTGAFANLQALSKISLGNRFGSIETEAFESLRLK